jgi:transposase
MRALIFVRPLSDEEAQTVAAGLRSSDAFTVRRCQIVRGSAAGESVPRLARRLGCDEQTVRDAIHAFRATGVAALRRGSSRPHTIHAAFPGAQAEALRDLLHRSPRDFGHPTSLWTLALAADEAVRQGLTPSRVSDETIRATLARLGVRWRRAKQWITSPDPGYRRKKASATG